MSADKTIAWVETLHSLVDEVAAPITQAHAARLQCRVGCADCCVDGLTVFDIEAAVIRQHHAELLATALPHPPGACAFLDENRHCRIYNHRPYVCRTQGLPLRWLEEDDQVPDEIVEARDICPKNIAGGPPLELLTAETCWTIGPFEERLANRQTLVDGGRGDRIALRSLFTASTSTRRLPIVG
jgi:hypothetical protein